MTKTTQETGRSMVEMLGVLAVIGVLSVGGISGYTLAMNKHRANNVAADLMKRAVLISAHRQLGKPDPNMDSFGYQVGDYTLDENVDTPDAGKFAMKVKAVPQEVCEKILALDWDNAAISPTACAEGNNEMIFTYNNDLSPVTDSNAGGEGTDTPQEQTCEEGSTGNGCQKCENGALVADTDKNTDACGAGGVCANGECTVCDANNLYLCQSETECTAAQGKWCGSRCVNKQASCGITGGGDN